MRSFGIEKHNEKIHIILYNTLHEGVCTAVLEEDVGLHSGSVLLPSLARLGVRKKVRWPREQTQKNQGRSTVSTPWGLVACACIYFDA